jgi:hypothetical protein
MTLYQLLKLYITKWFMMIVNDKAGRNAEGCEYRLLYPLKNGISQAILHTETLLQIPLHHMHMTAPQ